MKRLALIALAGALTTGCVTVFPKSEPAQLYRFELPSAAAQASAPAGRVGVIQAPITFDRAAQGDTILTVTGGQAAYIAGARWVAPAAILFENAVDDAFTGSPVLLLSRGEIGQAGHTLKIDVRRFEADYADPKGSPSVVVEIDASLVRNDTRALLAERRFVANVPAADNRVGAIVPAFDAALGQILPQLVMWTGQTVSADGARR